MQVRNFGDAPAAHVEEAEERVIAKIRLQGDDALELLLGQDALGQAVGHLRAGDGGAHVIYKVPNAVTEREEALHRAELAAAGGRGQALRFEVIGPVLQIAEAHVAEREVGKVDELKEVALVGLLGVWGFAVEPELNEVAIVVVGTACEGTACDGTPCDCTSEGCGVSANWVS